MRVLRLLVSGELRHLLLEVQGRLPVWLFCVLFPLVRVVMAGGPSLAERFILVSRDTQETD